jgi:hypothetical protein
VAIRRFVMPSAQKPSLYERLGGVYSTQNKISDAEWVRKEFDDSWKNADVTLELGDL